MPLFMNVLLAFIFAMIAALHFLAVFTEKYAKVLLSVNIALHILMLLPLLYHEASMQALVMIYFASVTVRSVLSFVYWRHLVKANALPVDNEGKLVADGRDKT